MRASIGFSCVALVVAGAFGCGDSSGAGGSGGTGTTSSASSSKASSSSSKASSGSGTTTTGTGTGTGGAGGGVPVNCNPVKDVECDTANGEGCDYGDNGMGFICYVGPDLTLNLCDACDPTLQNAPFCKDGLTCMPVDGAMTMGKCVRFCCSDADCGAAVGSCDKTLSGSNTVGLCGAPDAGHTFIQTPVCTGIPATPPSNGSCYTTP